MARRTRAGRWAIALVVLALGALAGCRSMPAPRSPAGGALLVDLGAWNAQADSVLYLDAGTPHPTALAQPDRVEIASEGPSFAPGLAAVAVGGEIRFVNHGPLAHQLFANDGPQRRERGLRPGGVSNPLQLDRTGPLHFYCSLHPDEDFFVFVAPSPFFVVPDGRRRRRLEAIPDGRYRIRRWSETGTQDLGTVEIRAGETTPWSIGGGPRTAGPGSPGARRL